MQIANTVSKAAPPESFAALFEESLARKEMRVGEVITAEVIRVDANHVDFAQDDRLLHVVPVGSVREQPRIGRANVA